jgi:NitT/TauT family transport system substrate-binding protein
MRRPLLTLTAALGLLLTAACGGGDEAAEPAPGVTAGGGSTELMPVTVGVIPILDVAPAYLCQEQGIFEENGLDVTLEPAQGGATIVPAVLAGQQQSASAT